jgi:hypothetical protein
MKPYGSFRMLLLESQRVYWEPLIAYVNHTAAPAPSPPDRNSAEVTSSIMKFLKIKKLPGSGATGLGLSLKLI